MLRRTNALLLSLSGKRPETADETVPGECRLRLLRRGRRKVEIEPGCVPLAPEIVDGLPVGDGALHVGVRCQPGMKLGFRPEGQDVCSGEANVIPEAPGRHEKVHDRVAGDLPVQNVETDGCTGLRRVHLELTIADDAQDRQTIPHAIGIPLLPRCVYHEVSGNGRERVRHPDRIRARQQDQAVLIRKRMQCLNDI